MNRTLMNFYQDKSEKPMLNYPAPLHRKTFVLVVVSTLALLTCSPQQTVRQKFNIPKELLEEPAEIPQFWKSTVNESSDLLEKVVKKGSVEVIGTSAGGRPIQAVFYGKPREGSGTSTFSGSLGFGDVRAFRGPDHDKTVYIGMSAVHGGEFEGIVGTLNLISVLETGKDLRGKDWPEITSVASKLDRLIIIPIMNPDGRDRIPLRMEKYAGDSYYVHEFFNTGAKTDLSLFGWPNVKEYIPLDFSTASFPGGYPNDAGVNIMHDDFFGQRQPETQALFDLVAKEKPDLILNMHTGAPPDNYYARMHRPFVDPGLNITFGSLYRKVHTALALGGLQETANPDIEAKIDISDGSQGVYNLDAALNLHCGALSVLIEFPSHSFSGKNRKGDRVLHNPEMILDAELTCHQEAMKFLAETGGRSKWTPGRN